MSRLPWLTSAVGGGVGTAPWGGVENTQFDTAVTSMRTEVGVTHDEFSEDVGDVCFFKLYDGRLKDCYIILPPFLICKHPGICECDCGPGDPGFPANQPHRGSIRTLGSSFPLSGLRAPTVKLEE